MQSGVRRLVFSAVFLALCLVLPLVTGQIAQYGGMLLPMHLPVLLCGFVCGAPMGALVGVVAPLMRFLIFGMPPVYTAVSMAFELCAYGFVTGFLYARLPRGAAYLYVALIAAMVCGRAVYGVVQPVILSLQSKGFTFYAFLFGAFINAWPGIVCQLLLVPPIVMAFERARLIPPGQGRARA